MSHSSTGKYYLCDAAYTNTRGFMAPYHNTRYWIGDFQRTRPLTSKDTIMNMHNLEMLLNVLTVY